ncbi:MAG: hypothetical protein P1P71_07345 [Anaerosomatales bacterium]|nr:hypothetical protein [Anaerosomatales bacterium]
MVVSVFTTIMLALGVGVCIAALVYIVGMVVSIAFGMIYAPVDEAIHHGHPHGAV